MGQSTISVRLDDTIKKQFDSLCAEFGMSASTAFNIYARTVVRQMEQHPERNVVKTLEELEELADG